MKHIFHILFFEQPLEKIRYDGVWPAWLAMDSHSPAESSRSDFFFGSLAFGMPGRLAFNKCRETVDRHVVPDDGSPACNKFIVLTTQRSGSTWFC